MDTNASYLLRWRGRQQGPFTLAQIERKLSEQEIGMLHEIQMGSEWITLRDCFEGIEAARRAQAERGAPALARVSAQSGTPQQQQEQQQSRVSAENSISAADYVLAIGSCVSRAWFLVTRNVAVTLVTALLFSLISALPLGLIQLYNVFVLPALMAVSPFIYFATWAVFTTLSLIVYAVIWGPFYGGLAYTYIGLARGEDRYIGDLFAGFSRRMGHAMLGWLAIKFFTALAVVAGLVPFVILAAAAGVRVQAVRNDAASAVAVPSIFWIVLMAAYLLLVYLPMLVLLAARWFYVVPLVVDRQVGFWPAMALSWHQVGRHQWGFLGLWFVALLIGCVGILLCGVGMVFTCPLSEMTMMVAYVVMYTSRHSSRQ
jgi:hypothetical protein